MKFDTVSGIRVTHKGAAIDEIETLSRRTGAGGAEALVARDHVSEAFVLGTCHRAEVYVVTDGPAVGRDVLGSFASSVGDDAVVDMDHQASLRHLLRVAAGLESMILGEEEILGQIREAHATHAELGTLGPLLDTALTKAIHVGQRARTETAINEGTHSITSAAVDLAGAETDLAGATVLLVGAGNMGTGAGRAVAETAVERLVIANRTRERASRLADEIEALPTDVVGLDAIPAELAAADVVITATGSDEFVVEPAHVEPDQTGVIVDIAQPRDVDPAIASESDWTLHDLSALESVTDETLRRRRRAAHRVEALVDEECERLREQYKQDRVEEVISSIHSEADSLKARHVETVLSKLEANGGLTEEQRSIVESFADALLSDLLAAPTHGLKDAAVHDEWSTIQAAIQLFDPTEVADTPPLPDPARTDPRPDNPRGVNGLETD